MVDNPSEILQTRKILGPNSPRGRFGGQKGLNNPENLEKLSPGRGGGYCGGRPLGDTAAAGGPKLHISGTPIAQGPKLRPKGPLPKVLLPTKFRVETHQGAGSVGKKVLKI